MFEGSLEDEYNRNIDVENRLRAEYQRQKEIKDRLNALKEEEEIEETEE